MSSHDLKTFPRFFHGLRLGLKMFDIRFNDRHFALGDVLTFREYLPERNEFTGETETARVTYILNDEDFPSALAPGYCVLGLQPLYRPPAGTSRACDSPPEAPGHGLGQNQARILDVNPIQVVAETGTGEKIVLATPDFPVAYGEIHNLILDPVTYSWKLLPHAQ